MSRAGGFTDGVVSPLLNLPGAVPASGIDAGVAWHYGDPVAEQRALADGTAVTDLSHRGVLRITGADRLALLEERTTQGLRMLGSGSATEALLLTGQGWVEHEMHLVDDGEAIWATVEPGGMAGVLGRLRAAGSAWDVTVRDLTDRIAVLGECGSSTWSGEPVAVWDDPWPRVAPGSVSWSVVAGSAHPGMDRPWREVLHPRRDLADRVSGRRLAGSWAAEALRIEAWRPRADAEGGAGVLPQELDWLRTAVAADKGPYPGWEAVAWAPGEGSVRQRLVMLHLDGSESVLPEADAPVFRGKDRVGRVTSAVLHHELGPVALALIRGSTPPRAVLETTGVAAAQELILSS
jgi:tRNA-modifying protein YgfZ